MAMLDFLFTPLTSLDPVLSILIVSASVSTLINLCYKFMIDQSKARAIKERARELQREMKELQKKNDMESMNKIMSEAMKNNTEQMRLMLKPMLVSMLVAVLTLPWLNQTYAGISVAMPASIPYIGSVVPFGWIGWYVLCSMPCILITRKLFGLEM